MSYQISEDVTPSSMDVGGPVAFQLVTKTSAYTAANERTILVDCTSGAVTITLPAASGVTDREYVIKKIDVSANAVTVDADGSETIDGAATLTIDTQYESFTIQCDGSNWHII